MCLIYFDIVSAYTLKKVSHYLTHFFSYFNFKSILDKLQYNSSLEISLTTFDDNLLSCIVGTTLQKSM